LGHIALAFMWVPDSYSDCDYVSQIYVVMDFSDQLIHWQAYRITFVEKIVLSRKH